MAKYIVEDTSLTSVADAIRTKSGTAEALVFPAGFVSAVEGITAGGSGITADDIATGNLWDNITLNKDMTIAYSFAYQKIKSVKGNLTKLSDYAFYNCNDLISVDFPNLTDPGNNAFEGCSSLVDVNMPNITRLGKATFYNCKNLVSCSLPNMVNGYGGSAFRNCTSLKNVYLPLAQNLDQTFDGCTSIEEVLLPSMNGAVFSACFKNCVVLKKVDFGGFVDFNRTQAFYGCTSLEAVIFRGNSISRLGNVNNFENCTIATGTGYIYVPRALLSDDDETKDYRRATNWATYATQFRAIEDYPEICGEVSA